MADIIRLLPDSVANQIAAGEVVQRPASAAKELLENAIDAGATEIKLLVREAGKNLVRVIDNGCGMSEQDARMCFERHATSKIKSATDLLAIRTLGFRGEALASIASIAQVEMKTCKTGEEVGTMVEIHGAEFIRQSPVSIPPGTDLAVKNLFYNVPARRNFLKSNTLELKYIMEEFFRVALVNPDITFYLYNNDKVLFHLPPSNLKQRIINLFGASFSQRLIPVEQETPLVNISGYIGKPEFARKTRGEQYFFTNGRFIKNPYLNHAVENAFQELIPKDAFAAYFIYMEVDPQTIDINIHPTKTEINFQDARSIYSILNSAVKQAIGKFNLSASLDFETEKGFDLPPLPTGYSAPQPSISINPDYNPFEKSTRPQTEIPFTGAPGRDTSWEKLMDPLRNIHYPVEPEIVPAPGEDVPRERLLPAEEESATALTQLLDSYIVTQMKSGIVIIDQQAAHERVLYEQYLDAIRSREVVAQRLLLPRPFQTSPDDTHILEEIAGSLGSSGLEVTLFGKDTFLIHALPAGMKEDEAAGLIELILEEYKKDATGFRQDTEVRLARTLARKASVKNGKKLRHEEMQSIVESLFSSHVPDTDPDGRPTMFLLSREDLQKKFKS